VSSNPLKHEVGVPMIFIYAIGGGAFTDSLWQVFGGEPSAWPVFLGAIFWPVALWLLWRRGERKRLARPHPAKPGGK
jgi:hypothetical protein